MGFVNKLKEILFDEVTEEIPIITKETTNEKVEVKKNDDEVRIKPIKKEDILDDDLFDMPKLKEEAREEKKMEHTFTFPVFDDEDLEIRDTRKEKSKQLEIEEPVKEEKKKYEYTSPFKNKKEEKKREYQTSTSYTKTSTFEEKKKFTPSPVISPVYGILNENYKKEDIITKNDSSIMRLSSDRIDLDSVRKKAYGTLEDEIDKALTIEPEPVKEEIIEDNVYLEESYDDGLTINDLLVEDDEEVKTLSKKVKEEIELDDEENSATGNLIIPSEENEALGEEDLFDLIDSLYAGKDEY